MVDLESLQHFMEDVEICLWIVSEKFYCKYNTTFLHRRQRVENVQSLIRLN